METMLSTHPSPPSDRGSRVTRASGQTYRTPSARASATSMAGSDPLKAPGATTTLKSGAVRAGQPP